MEENKTQSGRDLTKIELLARQAQEFYLKEYGVPFKIKEDGKHIYDIDEILKSGKLKDFANSFDITNVHLVATRALRSLDPNWVESGIGIMNASL